MPAPDGTPAHEVSHDGYLMKTITAHDIIANNGVVTITPFSKPFDKESVELLAVFGHLIGKGRLESTYHVLESRGLAYVEDGSLISNFYHAQVDPSDPSRLLNKPLAAQNGLVAMPLAEFRKCEEETRRFLESAFPIIDLAKFAVRINPLSDTNHLGEAVAAEFVPDYANEGNQIPKKMVLSRGNVEITARTISFDN